MTTLNTGMVPEPRLADFIQANEARISQEWENFARSLIPNVKLSKFVLRDHIGEILTAIMQNMRQPQSETEQSAKAKGQAGPSNLDEPADEHGALRLETGFQLDQVISEFRALRASIVRLWKEEKSNATNLDDMTRFHEAIDELLIVSTKSAVARLDRYRDEFIGILGHDLRTPLTAIIASAAFLTQSKELSGLHLKAATRVTTSATRMSRMISDLLDLTRSQLGPGFPISPSAMDLEQVCRQVLDEVEASHPGSVLNFLPSGDLHGDWDADRVAQLISNLAVNALHHGDETSPIIVTARDQGDEICLTVHNGGQPIPPEEIGAIFEPMRTVKQGQLHEGLGLGLFIVREIANSHGGVVTVASTEKQGTTFTVRLPRHTNASQS